jgi:hydroxyacylglutathione hydrolase
MEIISGVHQIPGVQGNCYLLERDGLVLIDSGLPKNSKKIISYIRNTLHKDPLDIRYIILTHYHVDHIGNAAELKKISGAKIAIHEDDTDYLLGNKASLPLKGFRGKILGLLMLLWPVQPITPNLQLYDGDQICGMQCIHTPGHTPGSIVLYDPNLKLLFSGDAVVTKKGVVSGPPPSATHDMAQAMESARKISQYDFEYLLSGHGIPVMEKGSEKVREFCNN